MLKQIVQQKLFQLCGFFSKAIHRNNHATVQETLQLLECLRFTVPEKAERYFSIL